METAKKRKTIRKYTDQPIADALLNELLEASCRASTMGNLQLYSVVVTRDAAMKERLAPLHFNQPMVMGAPVVLTFCADYNRTTAWCRERDAQAGYDNFLSFVNAATDALLVTQTFCSLAEEQGLGICFLGTTLYAPDKIIETLQLPKLVMPVATITVGYPAEDPAQPERLPLEAVVHQETYCDYDRAAIDRLYADKEALPENEHFVKINNKANLAQVFAEVRYTKGDNEAISATLLRTLREQGFLS